MDDSIPNPSKLNIGQEYSMAELVMIFGSGGFNSGINPRTDNNGDLKYTLLTHTEDSKYLDELSGNTINYSGQNSGSGDQPMGGVNGRLIKQHESLTHPIYFVSREKKGDPWTYQGLVDVVDHDYVIRNGHKEHQFELVKLGVATAKELKNIEEKIEAESKDPLLEESEERRTDSKRIARSNTFRRKVKDYYDNTCAMCGASRYSPSGTSPEVEAAHIYPRSENGRDHYRNGIALCRLHHWGFDKGWLSIDNNYQILVLDNDRSEANEFQELEGEGLILPADEEKWPAVKYLREHRRLHGFEK